MVMFVVLVYKTNREFPVSSNNEKYLDLIETCY